MTFINSTIDHAISRVKENLSTAKSILVNDPPEPQNPPEQERTAKSSGSDMKDILSTAQKILVNDPPTPHNQPEQKKAKTSDFDVKDTLSTAKKILVNDLPKPHNQSEQKRAKEESGSHIKDTLSTAKKILVNDPPEPHNQPEQKSLTKAKSVLEGTVSRLRSEKHKLEKDVVGLKETLSDLSNDVADVAEQRQEIIIQAYTAGFTSSHDASSDISGDENKAETAQISRENSVNGMLENDDEDAIFEDADESVIYANSTDTTAKSIDDAIVENSPVSTFDQRKADFSTMTQPGVEEQDVASETESQDEARSGYISSSIRDDASVVSASASPTSTPKRKRRGVKKAYTPPKKWRRMKGSGRLRSIIITD